MSGVGGSGEAAAASLQRLSYDPPPLSPPTSSHRALHVVPKRLKRIEEAYVARNFGAFAEIAMADSNQFHAVALDTYPPIFYLNESSRRIIALVHKANAHAGRVVAGYTFDAGPNAVIFTLRQDAALMLALLLSHFPPEGVPGIAR